VGYNKNMKIQLMALVPTALLLMLLVALPLELQAAERLVPCDGTDCSFCDLVVLGSRIINWFFGLVFVLFGVITFVAGFNLMTSGGNQTKLDDAKKKLSNAIIGLIIVFSAWLIVDTLMKAIVPGGNVGDAVNVDGLGMWNTIECGIAEMAAVDPSGPTAIGDPDDLLIPPSECRQREWRNIARTDELNVPDPDGSPCTFFCDTATINRQQLWSFAADPLPSECPDDIATISVDVFRECTQVNRSSSCVNWRVY
jgi:hypothetical protein